MTARLPLWLCALSLLAPGCHEGGSSGPCAEVTCSGHGTCVEEGSSARCECSLGYRSEGLECLESAADGDADADEDAGPDAEADADREAEADGEADADGEVDGGDPVDRTMFCTELARVLCEGHLACCSEPDHLSVEDCVAAWLPDCTAAIGPIVMHDRTGYDPARARLQLDEGRRLAAGCALELRPWSVERERLLSVLQGSRTLGEPCVWSLDEALRLENYFTCVYDSTCRVLTVVPFHAECSRRAGEGGACRGHPNCETGYRCADFGPGRDGSCQARLADGSACVGWQECESYFCTDQVCQAPDQDLVYCSNLMGAM